MELDWVNIQPTNLWFQFLMALTGYLTYHLETWLGVLFSNCNEKYESGWKTHKLEQIICRRYNMQGASKIVFCMSFKGWTMPLFSPTLLFLLNSLLYQNSPSPWICITSLGWSTTVFGRRLTVHTKQVSQYNRYIESISPNVGAETNGSDKTWIGKNDRRHQPSQSSILL